MAERVYCNGALTPAKRQAMLAAKLDNGMVCTDYIPRGQNGNDVAYFRPGTPVELEDCRRRMKESTTDVAPRDLIPILARSQATTCGLCGGAIYYSVERLTGVWVAVSIEGPGAIAPTWREQGAGIVHVCPPKVEPSTVQECSPI